MITRITLYVNETEVCKFKTNDNAKWYIFCLKSVSKIFTGDEQSWISINGTVYDFSVDHRLIKKITFFIFANI